MVLASRAGWTRRPCSSASGRPRAPHGARWASPGGSTAGGHRVRGGVIARCHLSRWGRLGRGYSGTDESTHMVVVFVFGRSVAG